MSLPQGASGISSQDGSVTVRGGGATVDLSVAVTTSVNMAGDVIGTTLASKVVAIQGYSVVATVPSSGQVLVASGGSWTPMSIPLGISAGTGIGVAAVSGIFTISNTGVLSVAADDSSVTIGGTAANPTIVTGRLDQIAAAHPTGANWSNNGFKITGLANGTAATDAAAFGQIPLSGSTVVGPDAFGASASPGSAATWSRSDHDHGLPANPLTGWNGWINETHTWTFSSTDTHTFVVTVNADITGYVGVGMRVKLTNQSATQYFIVHAISVASGTTTVTLYGGPNYSLTNTAITNPAFSPGKAPQGFPLDPVNWTETTSNSTTYTTTNPTVGVYTAPGGSALQLVVPIGAWNLRWQAPVKATMSVAGTQIGWAAALSTSASSVSDVDLKSNEFFAGASAAMTAERTNSKFKGVNFAVKTTVQLIVTPSASQGASGVLGFAGADSSNIISATSAYL